jgi:hypothetical protein
MIRFALLLALAMSASAFAVPPQTPPRLCASEAFGDLVGTTGDDRLQAPPRATRVWGFEGSDGLLGSATRAACLIGGPGRDVISLDSGGGLAYGNQGRDTIVGSALGDVIRPGYGTDGVEAGGGDDKIGVRDRAAEVVDCGAGSDIVKADRRDILIGCEAVNASGPRATRLSPSPSAVPPHGLVRVGLTIPRAAPDGAYRAITLTDCGHGLAEVARFGAVSRQQRVHIGLHHPEGGWCPGRTRVAIVRSPGPSLPLAGVARLSFAVR